MTKRLRSIYHGYVQIAEIDATDETAPYVAKTYRWDPSEPVATRPLALTLWTREGTARETLYYAHDLRKNVVSLFDAKGLRRASYQYDPYGNITSMEGDMAKENPYRFSSEYHDEGLGLVYYNFRHYNPTDGRWISRDPIAEKGGWNLYGFVANNALYYTDKLGLVSSDPNSPYHTEPSPYINRQSDSRKTNNKKIDDSSLEYDGEEITPEMVRDCMYGKAYIDERVCWFGSTIVEWKYGQCFTEPQGRHKRAYVVAKRKPSNSTTLKNGKTYPCAKVMDAYSKHLQGIPAITVRVYRIMCQNEKTFEEIYHFSNGNDKPTLLGFRDINELSQADLVGYGIGYQGGGLAIGLFRGGLIGIRFHIEATNAKDGWHVVTISNKSYYFGK